VAKAIDSSMVLPRLIKIAILGVVLVCPFRSNAFTTIRLVQQADPRSRQCPGHKTSESSFALFMSGREPAGRDFYEVLGVPKDANTQVLKQAYRVLAKLYHPGTYTYCCPDAVHAILSVLLNFMRCPKHQTTIQVWMQRRNFMK
jgi:hypothetical protein